MALERKSTWLAMATLIALNWAQAAHAQTQVGETIQQGINGAMPAKAQQFRCTYPQYLYGLALTLTDRITGLYYECREASPDGGWAGSQPFSVPALGDTKPYQVDIACPPDHFITAVGFTTGHYAADSHGIAQPEIGRLLADIQPVCRRRNQPETYRLNRNFLTGADDNDLKTDPALDSTPRDCPATTAAIGVVIDYDGRRDIDPTNRFHNLALICRPLKTEPISRGVDVVPTPIDRGLDVVPPTIDRGLDERPPGT